MKFIRDFKSKDSYTNFKDSSKRKTLTSHPESDTEEQVILQKTDYEIYYKTSDNHGITLGTEDGFGATIESNEYPKYSGTVSFDDKPTTIPESSFSSQDTLTSVELPSGVTTIESGSFSNSSNLNNVTINSETVTVEENSFNGVADTGKLTISNEQLLNDMTFNNEFIGWNAYKSDGTFIETIQEKEPDYSLIPMFFENVDESAVTIGVTKNNYSAYTATLETSTDGVTWTTWGSTSTTLTKSVPVGGKLYIRATSDIGYFNNTGYFNYFTSTGKVKVVGNIMSLGYKNFEDKTSITQSYAYRRVFSGMTKLVNASKLVLPATTLVSYCYNYMFYGCSSLTTAPSKLPATTLASYCYDSMFYGCTSLTTAPELPATTLASSCYFYMFYNCSKLNYIKALFTTEPGTAYTENWVSGVAGTGTFVKNIDATWDVTGVNGIPTGWTVQYSVPVDSIELVDATEIPETLYANQTYVKATVKVNYTKEDGVTTGSYTTTMSSNDFGENTSGANRTVNVTFEYFDKSTSVERTQTTKYNYASIPLFFENVDTSAVTIGVKKANSGYTATLETSTDGTNWTTWGSTSTTALTKSVPVGGKLYIRATSDVGYLSASSYTGYFNYFTSTGKVNVGGNIMSLGYKNFGDKTSITQQYAYRNVFNGMTKLVDASKLVLPATTLVSYCYYYMFYGCSSLTTAPSKLPATTLASSCYFYMFQGCSKLTTAPELPATTLASNCYSNMFQGCSKLTTAPELPATTLASSCYSGMFQGCSSLTIAPELPATTLASSCYSGMFQGCSSLTIAPELPATTLASSCYFYMFQGCSKLTTAPELPATTLASNCYEYMFRNCTSLTTAPELPATTLASGCYSSMFRNCTSLTTAPELPATTLVDSCYGSMFTGCSKLNYIKALFTTEPGTAYTENWVSGVAGTGTFVKNIDATWDVTGVNGIPTGWTVQYNGTVDSIELVDATEIPETLYANQTYVKATVKVNYTKEDGVTTGSFTKTMVSNNFGENTTGTNRTVNVTFELSGKTTSVERTQSTEENYIYTPMYFENVDTSSVTIGVKKYNTSAYIAKLETSTDGATWETWGSTSTTALTKSVPVGGKLYIRATSDVGYFNYNYNNVYYNYFTSTGKVNVGGNIMSLGYKNFEDKTSITQTYAYQQLFSNMTQLVDASNLVLPATTLASYCYYGMFLGCSSLTTAPELPATTLASGCYSSMFCECCGLTTAPELPATTLASNCYEYMFYGCTSLTIAPELPATTLVSSCYFYMFQGCSKLTTAPELPATTLANYCYQNMFYSCANLTSAPSKLPATTLAEHCYHAMFHSCSSLTTAPELPATTLADYCYFGMFQNCCLTTAPELPATTLASYCYYGMFLGCSSLTTAPELPATTLASGCYSSMFCECCGLTTVPELPATTLVSGCYEHMFQGCGSLNYIKALYLNIQSSTSIDCWVNGVASTGIFVKNSSSSGTYGIPTGWTIIKENTVIDSIELVDATEIPETLYANQTYVKATVKVNYTKEDSTTDSFTKTMESNDFGENTTGTNRTVNVTFECLGKSTSVERTQTTDENYMYTPMYFENVDESPVTIGVKKDDSGTDTVSFETSTDGSTWTSWCSTSTTELTKSVPVGGKLYIRAICNVGYLSASSYTGYFNYFTSTGKVNVGGNIMSLGYKNFGDKTSITQQYAYRNVFNGMTKLVDASKLVLPATTLVSYCYYYMFYGCSSLTTAPSKLPATTLATNCYYGMFNSCSSLTTTPELPATTLASSCYSNMFQGCSSLTTAPELPATTLASSCYSNMFQGCSSLTIVPELPATTLASSCYFYMFQGCSKLTTAPELPATTLASSCYSGMFQGCSSLTIAPELPATTLASYCYAHMFYGCSKLTTAPELPATTLASNCYEYMFRNCTSLTTAPELPATTLASNCYEYMFRNCTSLTTAPELPATTLVDSCYGSMFTGCSKLNYIKALFTTEPGTAYTSSWVSGVASAGTFVKNVNATWDVTGVNGVPTGWIVETASE